MRAIFIALPLLIATSLAQAHGLLLAVESENGRIVGNAYFTNGEKAAAQTVEAVDLDEPAATTQSAVTAADGSFTFSVIDGHRYRVSVFGEEGHEVQTELTAGKPGSTRLIETNAKADDSAELLPPAWAVIGGLLLLSLIPVFLRRLKSQRR